MSDETSVKNSEMAYDSSIEVFSIEHLETCDVSMFVQPNTKVVNIAIKHPPCILDLCISASDALALAEELNIAATASLKKDAVIEHKRILP